MSQAQRTTSTGARKPRRPGRINLHSMFAAISRAQKLSAEDVSQQVQIMRGALTDLQTSQQPARAWRSLADAANMAETLEGMGLGSGPQAQQVIQDAQAALAAVWERGNGRGSWAMRFNESDSISWLIALHAVQLGASSYGAFEDALRDTHNRVAQARAGNAPAGAIVITGDIA